MADIQAIVDFSFQINKFVNIDLFQRGLYQIRLVPKLPNCKLPHKIEVNNSNSSSVVGSVISSSSSTSSLTSGILSDTTQGHANEANLGNIISPACIINGSAVSKTFQIVYRNEEVHLNDNAPFRVSLCLDSAECLKQAQKITFLLQVEVWFSEQESKRDGVSLAGTIFECVSRRYLQIHFDLCRGVHYNLPVIFDYFHLCAITLSIHGSLVTLCQPYISKSDSSLWLSNFVKNEMKEERKTARAQSGLETGRKMHQYSQQIRRLQLAQWRLVSLLVSAMLSLRRKINEYYRVLPPWQQARVKFEKLFVDVSLANLSSLSQDCFKGLDQNDNFLNISSLFVIFQDSLVTDCTNTSKNLSSSKVEEMLTTVERDISYLCALTIDQWQRFLRLVSNSDRINQHLAKVHHLQRIKRFAEGFFCIEHARSDLYALSDDTSSFFCEISDFIRKSPYFTLLPPCDVECTYLDGDASTLPIIFEQKYEPMTTSEEVKSNLSKEVGSNLFAANSYFNSMGYFSSPSKHSLSSSSTSSSASSTKSNIRTMFSRLNYMVNDKNVRKELYAPNNRQELKGNAQVQVNTIDFLGLYRNDLFKEDETNFDQVNRRIKLLNSFLNKKEMIKSYSKMSLDYSDKKLKKIATDNHSTIVQMLRNTISLEQPISSFGELKGQSIGPLAANSGATDKFENSRSWPNLTSSANLDSLYQRLPKQHRSASVLSKKSATLHRTNGHSRKSSKSKSMATENELAETLTNTSSLLTMSTNFSNFKGTMYFPKPPKEFAMEGIDEPAEEVNQKPIPTNITSLAAETNRETLNDITKEGIILKEPPRLNLNCVDLLKAIDNLKIRNSSSCQDLTGMEKKMKEKKHEMRNSLVQSKDDNFLKCPSLGDSKYTFVELLRSDHCLVCCGSINNRPDKCWPCMCGKSFVNKEVSESAPPSLRRVSTIGADLLLFLHAKEEFRTQITKKNKNLLFYSDSAVHTLASRIPYFQCDPDFRAFNSHKDLHLIVCVHGLDGNSADLRLVRTYLELGLPTNNFDFLMSQRNQGETFDSLETLTNRLISEIDNYVMTFKLKPSRISFIGHSLGNIIIRSAISRHDFMRRWRDKLHTFLSLSGPHLGLSYNRSGLVNMGLWFIQKFKKSASLTQLQMKDTTNIRQTFLYQLSTKPGLELFRNILFCGSSQDYYVPIHSAHIELCNAALGDSSENGVAYREMANNILERLVTRPNLNIVRYDVQHALRGNANSLIGRAAHIAVLDSELFIEKFLVVVGLKYFV